jgi:hypothetical protein
MNAQFETPNPLSAISVATAATSMGDLCHSQLSPVVVPTAECEPMVSKKSCHAILGDSFQLTELICSRELESISALRVEAWRSHLVSPPIAQRWEDPEDCRARHWTIRHISKQLVAAARLPIHDAEERVPDSEVHSDLLDPLPRPIASLPRPIASLNRCVVHVRLRLHPPVHGRVPHPPSAPPARSRSSPRFHAGRPRTAPDPSSAARAIR